MEPNDRFNPNEVCVDNGNYFGMPFSPEEARLVIISVPWDVTTSYGGGSSFAPDAIIAASYQLDFYDEHAPEAWRKGIATIGIDYSIQDRNARLRADARKVIEHLENGGSMLDEYLIPKRIERINDASEELNRQTFADSEKWLEQGKLVGLVGGDHSSPLGLIKALGGHYDNFGILDIDAHCDLRKAYEGFTYSHASIMYNVLQQVPQVSRIIEVGVRDYCEDEVALAAGTPRVEIVSDDYLSTAEFNGTKWHEQCEKIVEHLPQNVYVSFDIDGLDPSNCPNTGTPVAGGLSFNKAIYLIRQVVASGRRLIGFDLCEVSPNEHNQWDANVGARVLYKLCCMTITSNKN